MGNRILTIQRQAREIGRLRTGYSTIKTSKNGKEYVAAEKSDTWILTSAQREAIELAAETWGGELEEWKPQGRGAAAYRVITQVPVIEALLPPGDPLSQFYEQWSAGGCQVRCDGESARIALGRGDERTVDCVCRTKHGDDWYKQDPKFICRPHTRLNVILPQLPDLGVWRVETQGFYSANDLPAQVDLIKAAVGPNPIVPIALRIVPMTRVRGGETIQTQTIVLSIRGAVAGQILAGQVPQLTAGGALALPAPPDRPAIETSPAKPDLVHRPGGNEVDWVITIRGAQTLPALRQVWDWMKADQDRITTEEAAKLKKIWWEQNQKIQAAQRPVVVPADEKNIITATTVQAPLLSDLPDERDAHWSAVDAETNWQKQPAAPIPTEAPPAQLSDGPEPDKDIVWPQIVAEAGRRKMPTDRLLVEFERAVGKTIYDADGYAMESFLVMLQQGKIE